MEETRANRRSGSRSSGKSSKSSFQEDSVVAALIPDPAKAQELDVTVIYGYLGEGLDPKDCRVYSDGLDRWAQFSKDAILHTQSLPDGQGTLVWLKRTTPVKYVQVHAQELPADLVTSGAFRRPRSAQPRQTTIQADPVPFALATPHHARQVVSPVEFSSEDGDKLPWEDAEPKTPLSKRREEYYGPGPYKLPGDDEPQAGDLVRAYQKAVEDYERLHAAYVALQSSRARSMP